MGAGQSADTKLRGDGKLRGAARRAFFKEHGRDPTEEEEHKFQVAYDRDDPTDAHLGLVAAEEADVHVDRESDVVFERGARDGGEREEEASQHRGRAPTPRSAPRGRSQRRRSLL